MKMSEQEKSLLEAAKMDKEAAAVYSDWLQDQGREIEAAQWRAKAGISTIIYQVYDTIEDVVRAEYKTVSACNVYISKFIYEKMRDRLIIKVFESRPLFIGNIKPNPKRKSWWREEVPVSFEEACALVRAELTRHFEINGSMINAQMQHELNIIMARHRCYKKGMRWMFVDNGISVTIEGEK